MRAAGGLFDDSVDDLELQKLRTRFATPRASAPPLPPG
jgi:hypothetical protein